MPPHPPDPDLPALPDAAGEARTSRLAVIASASVCLCPPLGGLFGILLGILALRQIAVSDTLTGRSAAWFAIVLGTLQVAALGGTGYGVRRALEAAHPVAARFVAGMATGDEGHLQTSVAAALKPAVTGENRQLYADAFVSRLGVLQQVRPRKEPLWKAARKFKVVSALSLRYAFETSYDLDFASGAPALVTLQWVTEGGEPRVLGFKYASSQLRNLELPMEASADVTPELQDYGATTFKPKPGLKAFRP